jgi:diguanylate cyclase (GGDEF)-like protein/PAS domain S-box-containing protein
VQQTSSRRAYWKEILRYFGFPLAGAGVLLLAFFTIQSQIVKEIHKGTNEILVDSARQQTISMERYLDLLSTRVELIANYDADTGPNTLVESLRTELRDDATDIEIGYANPMGDLFYSDQKELNVAGTDWFQQSLGGDTVLSTGSQNVDDGMMDVRVSASVNTKSGVHGVLFATLSNRNFSAQLKTLAYEGQAYSFVSDNTGLIMFVEEGLDFIKAGEHVKTYINDAALSNGESIARLKEQLKQNQIVAFRYMVDRDIYYAVCERLPDYDWYVFTVVPGAVADVITRQVSMYQMAMLFIILLVGSSMAAQSYRHEKETVKKLEADKDLLRQGAQRYQLITQLSNEVFFQITMDTGEISFNDTFEAMFGFAPPVCTVDHLDSCTQLFFEDDRKVFISLVNQLRAGDTEARADLRMVSARGIVRWKRVEIFAVFDQEGIAVQLVGKIVDIHRQKQSMQRLIRQADSEPLTGLLNRGAMERNIKAFLAGEGLGGRHALIMLDFDNFKAVNDTLGHAKGDQLLVSFANGMRRLFRSGDYLSRIGGDEYMIFLKNAGDDVNSLDKAEALREEMQQLSLKIDIPVSISVGIAVYDRDGETFERLYKSADEALYQVKRSGKNAIAFFSSPLHPEERVILADVPAENEDLLDTEDDFDEDIEDE